MKNQNESKSSDSVSRWFFALSYFASDKVFLINKAENDKNVNKRTKRDLTKNVKKTFYILVLKLLLILCCYF